MLRLRLAAQRISSPADDAVAAARAACGVQAQDERAARLAVRARTRGVDEADVVRACADGRLVRTWAMRGTLHLLPADDAAWIVPLLGPIFEARARRRMEELGLDADALARGRDAVAEALADGPLPRADLLARLAARGLELEGQARPHLLGHVARAGEIVLRADEVVARFRVRPLAREDALRELARRYHAAFGPADARDLAAWSGLSVPDAKLAWDGAGEAPADAPEPPAVRLLGAFDNVLLGWRDRGFVLDPAHEARIRKGGVLAPILLVHGRAAGTWRVARGRVELAPFAPLPRDVAPAADAEVDDVRRFLGSR